MLKRNSKIFFFNNNFIIPFKILSFFKNSKKDSARVGSFLKSVLSKGKKLVYHFKKKKKYIGIYSISKKEIRNFDNSFIKFKWNAFIIFRKKFKLKFKKIFFPSCFKLKRKKLFNLFPGII